MKKIILSAALLCSMWSFGQETEFKLSRGVFTDYVIGDIEGKTQSELYKKTLNWVNVMYNTPSEVIKGQIEGDYIRIEGVKSSVFCMKTLGMLNCNDMKYQIEISFKDGKYKFDVISIRYYGKGTQYTVGGWSDNMIPEYLSNIYREDGEIRGPFKLYPYAIETAFNDLNSSLKEFLLNETSTGKTKDW